MIVAVTPKRIDLMTETAVNTVATLCQGAIHVEAMATTANLYPLLPPGSLSIPSCATSGVQTAMVDSVELVSRVSSVHTLEVTPFIIAMTRTVVLEAAECSGVSGMQIKNHSIHVNMQRL